MCICLLFLLFQALQSFPHYYVLFLNSHWQIYFLPSLQGINGILADEMGLGKTVQSIALLAHLAEVRDFNKLCGIFICPPPPPRTRSQTSNIFVHLHPFKESHWMTHMTYSLLRVADSQVGRSHNTKRRKSGIQGKYVLSLAGRCTACFPVASCYLGAHTCAHTHTHTHESTCCGGWRCILLFVPAQRDNIWGPFLIISPASTLNNWHQEFTRFVPKFKVRTHKAETPSKTCPQEPLASPSLPSSSENWEDETCLGLIIRGQYCTTRLRV